MITIRVYLKEACQKWFIGYIIVMVNALKMTYVNRGIVHARATYCCDLLKFILPTMECITIPGNPCLPSTAIRIGGLTFATYRVVVGSGGVLGLGGGLGGGRCDGRGLKGRRAEAEMAKVGKRGKWGGGWVDERWGWGGAEKNEGGSWGEAKVVLVGGMWWWCL